MVTTPFFEVNFDGIVGPTHNYSGLSYGNIASMRNQQTVSNPQEAAIQGLNKMYRLYKLGLRQAVLPPHERPHIPTLRSIGFSGSDTAILEQASKETPELFLACCSAAAMWTANAATISPSSDTKDHRVHFTPANLSSKFHRSLEPLTTSRILSAIFSDPAYFSHHYPLPCGNYFADEGAANHTRFFWKDHKPGIHLFAFGRYAFNDTEIGPKKFPARQTYEAFQAICRLHQLDPGTVIFAQQNPEAIDAGAFHNDVISVGNQFLFFYHEQAFINTKTVIDEIKSKFRHVCGGELSLVEVASTDVSLADAISSYLFNSQIITRDNNEMILIAPEDCKRVPSVNFFLDNLLKKENHPIKQVLFFNLRQSMQNGGGPACLRLRVVLTESELAAANQHIFLNDQLYSKLHAWIKKHYREELLPQDLADPQLLLESRSALDELTTMLKLGPLYEFQK